MKQFSQAVVLLVLSAMTVRVGSAQGEKPAKDQAQPAIRVGVVDTDLVHRKSKWARGIMLSIQRRFEELGAQLKDLEKELKKKLDDQTMYTKGSRDFDRLSVEIGMLRLKLEQSNEMFTKWINIDEAQAELTIYEAISEVVGELARERGLDLVMRHRKTWRQAQEKLGRKIQAAAEERVLFASARLDLTDDVVSLLDNKKKAEIIEAPATGKSVDPTEANSKKAGDAGKLPDGKLPEGKQVQGK